jgi:hypothetical protein
MGNRVLTLLTAAISVVVAVLTVLLAIWLVQAQTVGPWLRRWLIGLAVVLGVLFSCLIIAATSEISSWLRTRKLSPLLARGETLNEVALRIPRDDRTRVLDFWSKYHDWGNAVMLALRSDDDRIAFASLDRGKASDDNLLPLADEQVFEVAGRVAVLRTIVHRLSAK